MIESLPQYLIKQLLWVIVRIIRSIHPQTKAMTKSQKNQIIALKPYDTAPKNLSQEGCPPPARYVSEKKNGNAEKIFNKVDDGCR